VSHKSVKRVATIMANRTSQHLDFLADHLKIVHVACIFVDFRIADDFLVEISPRCSVINRNLSWKHNHLTCADQRGRICTVTQSC
jgi:hypothetical protein